MSPRPRRAAVAHRRVEPAAQLATSTEPRISGIGSGQQLARPPDALADMDPTHASPEPPGGSRKGGRAGRPLTRADLWDALEIVPCDLGGCCPGWSGPRRSETLGSTHPDAIACGETCGVAHLGG